MSEFWTYALETPASHLNAGWFWLFPLLSIHDAEEATFVWMNGSLHNSISYTTLDVPQMLITISFELAILVAASAWAAEPGASRLAIFICAVLLGGYAAHLYLRWRAHAYTLGVATGAAVRRVRRLLQSTLELMETGSPELDIGSDQYCFGCSYHVAFDPHRALGRTELRVRSTVLPDSRLSV